MIQESEASRTREVVDIIISGINKGTFVPGERLPSQREMADLFGVSRTVIRESIKILEGRQIVNSRRGSGIYVCGLPGFSSAEEIPDSSYTVVSLKDIMEFGFMLWHESTRLMAKNATEAEINILTAMTRNFYDKNIHQTSLQERYIHETSFGLILAKYSHNPILYKVTTELFDVLSEVDYKVVEDEYKYREISLIDMRIVESLMERDVERALYMDYERIRAIRKIIEESDELMNSKCKVSLGLKLFDYMSE